MTTPTEPTQTPLSPCPFCGSDEISYGHNYAGVHWSQVECLNDACQAHVFAETEAEAIAAWNTRVHQPQPVDVERLKTLIAKRRAFVAAREAMNAARPTDTLTATRAQYVLYDERYQADNEACRELHREAARFAEWAADNEEAAISAMQGAGGEDAK